MTAQQIIFLIAALYTLASGVMTVISRNLIHAAFWLISAFFGVAAIYALLNANFIAIVQVVVYVGAIAILFIFAVMLTRRDLRVSDHRLNKGWQIGAALAAAFFVGIVSMLSQWSGFMKTAEPFPTQFDAIGALGEALTSPNAYVLPFEVASVLLLAALVGAVYVAFNPRSDEE